LLLLGENDPAAGVGAYMIGDDTENYGANHIHCDCAVERSMFNVRFFIRLSKMDLVLK